MPIRSEYWITDIGDVEAADGDIGDANHMAIVTSHAISLIYDKAENDPVAKLLLITVGQSAQFWDGDGTAFREALLNCSDTLARDPRYEELYEDYDACLLRAGVPEMALRILWDAETDSRLWAMESLGWMAVRQNTVTLHGLTDKRVQLLRDALWDIVLQEAVECPEDEEFTVFETLHNTRYDVTLQSLEDGLLSSLHPVARKVANALPRR